MGTRMDTLTLMDTFTTMIVGTATASHMAMMLRGARFSPR